jgi:type VI secretion system secreted protein VgrG
LSLAALVPLAIQREPIPEEKPVKFDMVLADMPGPNGIPISYMDWRIVRAQSKNKALFSTDIILEGESNAQGKLVFTADDDKKIHIEYNKTPNELWIIHAGHVHEFIAVTEKTHWHDKDKLYQAMDTMGYSDQLGKVGDWHVDEFHSDIARSELKIQTDANVIDKLKGSTS